MIVAIGVAAGGRLGGGLYGSSRCGLVDQPDHSLHIVGEIGEADFGSGADDPDGADEQAQAWRAKTCSTAAHTADLRALARAVRCGIGLPLGFLRWICERSRRPARKLSLAFER